MKQIRALAIASLLFTTFVTGQAAFISENYVTGQSFITTVAFSPDGQMFFIEKNTGLVKIVLGPNNVRPQPFYQFTVNSSGERGGLGLTFHPNYPDSPFVYCFVTQAGPPLANVIIRLIDSLGFGTRPETIFVAPIVTSATNHNGGNIRFGPDGKLYVTIGENAQPMWAQDTCNVWGKILRLNSDGSIPSDNPITCAPIFAYGLRNSYDFCFHRVSGILYASENGPAANDEINRILPGRNYGWPIIQCMSSNPAYENPLRCWTPTISPTGIVHAHNSLIPEFNGKLLMTDYNTGSLRLLSLNTSGDSITNDTVVYSVGFGLIDVEQGPDRFIYLTRSNGSIVRLRPAAPQAPNIFDYYPTDTVISIAAGSSIDFGLQAGDPDGDTLYFSWYRNGVVVGNNLSITLTFSAPGTEMIKAVVTDGILADSISWQIEVHTTGGTPPGPFSIFQPEDSSASVTRLTQFSWQASVDSDTGSIIRYWLLLDSDTTFDNAIAIGDIESTFVSVATDSLELLGDILFWKILAIDNDSLIRQGGIPMPEVRLLRIIPAGDVNANGLLRGSDVTFLVSYFKGTNQPPEPYLAADANGDCQVQGSDVTYLVRYFKGHGSIPARPDCP